MSSARQHLPQVRTLVRWRPIEVHQLSYQCLPPSTSLYTKSIHSSQLWTQFSSSSWWRPDVEDYSVSRCPRSTSWVQLIQKKCNRRHICDNPFADLFGYTILGRSAVTDQFSVRFETIQLFQSSCPRIVRFVSVVNLLTRPRFSVLLWKSFFSNFLHNRRNGQLVVAVETQYSSILTWNLRPSTADKLT